MNRRWLIGITLVSVIAFVGLVYGHGMGGGGMMAGRGFSSGGGHMEPMMGTEHGCCCPMMQHTGGYYGEYRTEQLTKNDAQTIVQDYLYRLSNPNLKQGKIKETDHEFEVEIVTKDNSLVEKLLIDKQTGWTRSTY